MAFYKTVLVCLLLGLFLWPVRLLAQPAVACDANAQCVARFDQARLLAQAGPSERALQTFQKLYQDYPDSRLLYWIARLQHLLGRPAEAIPMYRQFIDSGVEQDSEVLAKARVQLAAAQRSLSAPPAPLRQQTPTHDQLRPNPANAQPINPPSSAVPDDAPPSIASRRPIYRKAWFWGLLGGLAAAGIVLGVGVGVGRNTAPSDTRDLRWWMPGS